MATMVNKGDTTWMLISAALVLMMSMPGLALFYGGLVRAKNMLSVLMQVFMIVSVTGLCGRSSAIRWPSRAAPRLHRRLRKASCGRDERHLCRHLLEQRLHPRTTYFVFQMTFAMITPALFIGAFAERIKFWPLMLFTVLWSLLPISRWRTWCGTGRARTSCRPTPRMRACCISGARWTCRRHRGAHQRRYCGPRGLPGAGQARRFRQGTHPPHSLTMTMIGASLLWVGWFGFNAGSNLESNGVAAVAFVNTMLATCAPRP
jgi:Amt family ammonium transporter